jgi:hypothetical protein
VVSLYRIQTELTGLPGGSGLSTFHFLASAGSGQDAQDAVDDFWASIASHILLGITAKPLNECVTFEDTTGTVLSVTPVSGIGNNGSQTGEALPYATAGLIRWRTNTVVAGRRLQGRTFLPNPGETNSGAGGVPVAGYTAELAAAGAALIGSALSTPVVWSRPTESRVGSHGEITAASPWGQFAVLRSRRQ